MTNLLLIDGDEITYQAAHASQFVDYHVLNQDDDEIISFQYKKEADVFVKDKEDLKIKKIITPVEERYAYSNVRAILKELVTVTGVTDYSLFLSDPVNNYRESLATLAPYKGNREQHERPYYYHHIRKYIEEEEFGTVTFNQEADDALGIMQYSYNRSGKYDPIIVSQDKDLRMIAGNYYDRKTQTKHFISPEEGNFNFFCQLLTGDHTDNVPGIHRMGTVSAKRLLVSKSSNQDSLKEILSQYQIALEKGNFKYKTDLSVEEIVLEIGRLLWIRREPDQLWDFNTL